MPTKFRPVIDLHEGKVKQIVGSTLTESSGDLTTNFISEKSVAYYAELYRKDGLTGGHVIQLGKGNEQAAKEALRAYPGGLQIGGGIHLDNASEYLDAGASHVILTSWLFPNKGLDEDRLKALVKKIGKNYIVIDLSCRKLDQQWVVAMNRWQTLTELEVNQKTLDRFSGSCDEFLVHAADVEGKCNGIDEQLVEKLALWSPISVTYAGGARALEDLEKVNQLSGGRVDLSIGSALDIFGGKLIRYEDCVSYNKER